MSRERKRLKKLLMALFPRDDAEFYINLGLVMDLDYEAQSPPRARRDVCLLSAHAPARRMEHRPAQFWLYFLRCGGSVPAARYTGHFFERR